MKFGQFKNNKTSKSNENTKIPLIRAVYNTKLQVNPEKFKTESRNMLEFWNIENLPGFSVNNIPSSL